VALDTYDAILKNARRPLIVLGKNSQSLLIKMITLDDSEKRMPLGATPLSSDKIALIRRWIDAGAPEGKAPSGDGQPAVVRIARRARHLDVVIPSEVPAQGQVKSARGKMELILPIGPLAPVTAVAFSPDGKLLAAGSYGEVAIWNMELGRPIHVLTDFLGTANDLRFSPDGKLLATAGGHPPAKGALRLFRTDDWKLAAVLRGHEDVVFGIAFHPNGKQLASASFDKTVRIWSLESFKAQAQLTGHSDIVYAVAFSPDGKWVVSASKDRSLRVVDTAGWKGRLTLSGMNQDVIAVAVSPDGKHIVSAGYEPALRWWNPETGVSTALHPGHAEGVNELCFSKNGRWLASAGSDRTVRLWDGRRGAPERSLQLNSIVYAVAFSPDGKSLACGTFDGRVSLWDPATGKQLSNCLAIPRDGKHFDWLVVTPRGQLTGSSPLTTLARWQPAGQKR